jgi:hypothetical protein
LLHLRRGAYVYAGVALLPGNAHEVGPFFKLVEQFVQTVGKGVIQWLILDRGFIDGEQLSRCKQDWGIEVVIPMKKNMDIWADAWALAPQPGWQPVPGAPPPIVPIPPARPERLRRREANRQRGRFGKGSVRENDSAEEPLWSKSDSEKDHLRCIPRQFKSRTDEASA